MVLILEVNELEWSMKLLLTVKWSGENWARQEVECIVNGLDLMPFDQSNILLLSPVICGRAGKKSFYYKHISRHNINGLLNVFRRWCGEPAPPVYGYIS